MLSVDDDSLLLDYSKEDEPPRNPPLGSSLDLLQADSAETSNSNSAWYDDSSGHKEISPEIPTRESRPTITRRQIGLILMMCFVNYCNFVCYSLIAPFFPKEAVNKGGSQALASWVFSSYELVIFCVCPLFGKHIGSLGSRFLFVTGLIVTGTACGLFGLLSMVENYRAFVALAFSVRIVEAVGAGAYLTASFCIAATEFPSRVATVQGLLETACGMGICTGPAIGGALYAVGGYWTPFAVMGLVLVGSGLLSIPVLPPSEIRRRTSGSFLALLRIPGVTLASLTILTGAMAIGFYEPTLELHIDQFVNSPFQVGLVFLASAGTYALSSPLWGAVADRIHCQKYLMITGCVIVSGAFMLMGPTPFLGIKLQLWMVIVALLILGVGTGAQLVPALRDISTEALKYGFADNVNTNGLTSALFTSLFSLGAFLGPVIGGSLIDVISFAWSAFVISCINLLLAVFLSLYLLFRHRKRLKQRALYEPVAEPFLSA